MKPHRLILISALAIAALAVTGCKKDGVYKPSQKLSGFTEYYERVHQRYDQNTHQWRTFQKDSTGRRDLEKWVWDGKLLHHIDLYSQGQKTATVAFEYDGQRMTAAKIDATRTRVDYEYDGRRLKTMTVDQSNGSNISRYTFEYADNKVSTVTVTNPLLAKKGEREYLPTLLAPVLGDQRIVQDLGQMCSTAGNTKDSEYKLLFDWDDDNISAITYLSTGTEIKYRYDKKTNPLRGLQTTLYGTGEFPFEYVCANKNNIISVENGSDKTSYSYTYSSDLPTSRSRSVVDHYTQGYRYVTTDIIYYEYCD